MEQTARAGIPRMKELIGILQRADTAYYKYDAPIMTDREYDALYDELKMLEDASGIVISGSPTQKVSGEILEGLTEVEHTRPMLSAAKTKSVDEIIRFIGSHAALVSWKLDGLTLVLRYEGGRLKQAITRGAEGRVGEDVTHTVRVMRNVPLTIPYAQPLEVRGEGVVSWANFKQLNEALDEPYTHPRSLAAGSIRKLDASQVKNRMLEFIAFDLISGLGFAMKHEALQFLSDLGFDVVQHLPLGDMPSEPQIRGVINWFEPAECPYPVDGLIVAYARVSTREQNLDRQIDALREYGVAERDIVSDKASGKDLERNGYLFLKERMLREGDTLVIKSLDRLSRNKQEMLMELRYYKEQHIHVKVLDLPTTLIDVPEGQEWIFEMVNNIIMEVLASIAEQERNAIHQRQEEGITAAKAKGKHLGRPKATYPVNWEEIYPQWQARKITAVIAMKEMGVKRSTFYKLVRTYQQEK